MKWFKTLWLTSEERKALKEAKKIQEEEKPIEEKQYHVTSYFRNLITSPTSITVVMNDGNVLSKSGDIKGLRDEVLDATSEAEIVNLFKPQEQAEKSVAVDVDKQLVSKNLGIFKGNDEFVVKSNEVYLKGVNLAIPAPVTANFIEILEKQDDWHKENAPFGDKAKGDDIDDLESLEDQYHALKMFWLNLALNPLPVSREDTLIFVKSNDVRITRNGNLVLYRRVVSKDSSNKELIAFVSQQYYKVKKNKKSPDNFYVWSKDGILGIRKDKKKDKTSEYKGNLTKLYKKLGTFTENDYTSSYNRGQHTIRIGEIYKINDNEINLDNGICAAGGLHAAAVNYDYSGFGDTPIVVLVNPSKAITVPRGEIGKLRTTQMFVAAINDKPHGEHWDEDAVSAFDEEYHEKNLEELEEALLNKSFETVSIQDNVPAVSIIDIKEITRMLREERVSKVL